MAETLIQKSNLIITFKAAAAPKLKFVSMVGGDELSRLFEYSVVVAAPTAEAVDFSKLLGQPAQVVVAADATAKRHYHGIIAALSYEGMLGGSHRAYRLTLRPRAWLLTRRANSRIHPKRSALDLIKSVLAVSGQNVETRCQSSYRVREYCVQYRESDFNFISRLMEEEGIFYFFSHSDGEHQMVLADSASAHAGMLGVSTLPFSDGESAGESVTRWRWSQEIQTTQVGLRDHAFQATTKSLSGSAKIGRPYDDKNALQAFDYPAGLAPYLDEPSDIGKLAAESLAMAEIRLQEQQVRFALADGETNVATLCTGARFKLADHPVADQNGEYTVLSSRVAMRMPGYEAGASDEPEHQCQFAAFPSKETFRPARLTARPMIVGPQTATVVGLAAEGDIFTDKHGRVKLYFHWDRQGDHAPDKATLETPAQKDYTCFVRVAQPSAGKGWGALFLPRIGHEVVVEFLEGNPDRPLVVGGVYNGTNLPPYELPTNKSISTIKTRSVPDGGVDDYNELRFEDKKGSELLRMQAQKDMVEFVKNDAWVDIGNNQHVAIKKDRKEKIEGEAHLSVVGDVFQKFDAKFNVKSGDKMLLESGSVYSLKAAQDITGESGTNYSIKAGTNLHVKAGQNVGVDGGMNVHLKGGMNVVIEGGMNITLKAGAGSIVIGPDGVSITGPMVKINSGGSPGSGSGASPVAPTAPTATTAPEAPEDPMSHR